MNAMQWLKRICLGLVRKISPPAAENISRRYALSLWRQQVRSESPDSASWNPHVARHLTGEELRQYSRDLAAKKLRLGRPERQST